MSEIPGRSQMGRSRSLLMRFGPSLVGLAVFSAIALLYRFGDRDVYDGLLHGWGILPYRYPFLDMESVLRAIACARDGVNVWEPSVCMRGGWYTYSPFLLHAAILPIGTADRMPFGIFTAVAFLLSQSVLPPSKSAGEFWVRALAVISTASVFAVERANLDIIIFLATLLGVYLFVRSGVARYLGYGVFVLAALLKFYPAVLLLLGVQERLRIVTVAALIALISAGIFFSSSGATVALNVTPVGSPYEDMFGALNLPLGYFVAPAVAGSDTWDGLRVPLPLAAKALLYALILAAAFFASRHVRRDLAAWKSLSSEEAAFLVGGSVVIFGCFFAAQNVSYRCIFLLMTLPGLLCLARANGERRNGYTILAGAVLFLMWQELFRQGIHQFFSLQVQVFFWLLREFVWWWVIARLGSLIVAFVLSSQAFKELRRLAARARRTGKA